MNNFWRNVDKLSAAPCWLWTGGRSSRGYGRFHVGQRHYRYAHVCAWEDAYGISLPDRHVIHHTCVNKHCVYIGHLMLVTPEQHAQLHRVEPRQRRTHCRRGHLLAPPNLYFYSNGGRQCRQCQLEQHRVHNRNNN